MTKKIIFSTIPNKISTLECLSSVKEVTQGYIRLKKLCNGLVAPLPLLTIKEKLELSISE